MLSLEETAIDMENEQEIVKAFSEEMLKKIELRRNRYAPMGWKTMDIRRMIWLIKGEIEELERTLEEPKDFNSVSGPIQHMLNKTSTQDEALDVANYAMFIWAISQ